jgi:polyisoprenoid-binding protein YceI
MMKTLLIGLLFISFNTIGQSYNPVDSASKIHFVIKNFGINTGGDFTALKGSITFLPDNPAASNFNVSVASSTVDTDNKMRDKSISGNEYFNAAKYPMITIASAKIEKTNKSAAGFYYFTGKITIKGVTKTIAFPFQAKEENNGYLFTGNFEIKRTDFGVGEESIVLSNKVAITLSVFAKKS